MHHACGTEIVFGEPDRPLTKVEQMQSHRMVAVVGAGTMGSGIAEAAARAGRSVCIVDLDHRSLEGSRIAIERSLDASVAKHRLLQADRDAIIGRMNWADSVAAASAADLVIEAIVERLDAKLALLKQIEAVVTPLAVIATNTSSLSVEAMGSALECPSRFLGLHFFNPVTVMKLVEVVPSKATAPDVVQAMSDEMAAWGKSAVVVADVPGFIVNRVARPFYAEAFRAWDEGMDAASIDALIVGAGGFRMGPLALSDLIGQDINYAAAVSVHEAYGGHTRFRPQGAQAALVDHGRLGRKSGLGVFAYDDPMPGPAFIAPSPVASPMRVPDVPGDLAPLLERIASVQPLHVDPDLSEGVLLIGDVRVSVTDGRTLASRSDCDVLLDVTRDARTATVFGLAARNAAAASKVAGLLATLGASAIDVPDRPGMLLLRTLSQLASAAADVVTDDVASPHDVGIAMTLGANHPESPLSWADRVGPSRMKVIQQAIADADPDPIYGLAAFEDIIG